MSLNCHYLFIMKSPRDKAQIMNLAKQFSPYKTKHIIESFKTATRKPYSYLMLDFHTSTPDHLRVRSNIFPTEWPYTVWLEHP